ncbi:MAG: pitrilysin family protein [Proteobacteria bacterium]|nr:pitrilysin family protein [Pseudomonadota bacterium]
MLKTWRYAILSLLVFSSGPAWAVLQKNDVEQLKLKNGMKVLLIEDHSIPNANMYTFWKVGSRNEVPGITGLSHFFEHMMFNGSKNFPPGSFDKVMEAAGGSNNAYTTENVTVYTNWFTAKAMKTIFELEADRISSLEFDEAKINSERGVVLSERSTGLENDPWDRLYQNVKSAAFQAHPYTWPVIGWESDIKAWTKDDLIHYFKTYYNPSNAVMVISGDFKSSEVKTWLKDKIEPIARDDKVPPVRTIEPPQLGEKRVVLSKETESAPQVLVSWHVPNTQDADYYALDLLSEILSGGPSSRLHKLLVDGHRLAAEVNSDMPLAFDPTLFSIMVMGLENRDPLMIEKLMLGELEIMKTKGIDASELQKAKNKKLVELYRHMETINGKAELLGNYEVFFGGYERLFEAADAYERVKPNDIKKVLLSYFTKNNRTVGIQSKSETAK